MEKEGLVQSQWIRQDSGRKRKYYAITVAGTKVLEKEKAQWHNVDQVLRKLWQADSDSGTEFSY